MLTNELHRDSLPQSLLFYGPEGSGKFLAALELARVLNCAEGGVEGCGCSSCRSIEGFFSRNLFLICRSSLKNTFELWKTFGVEESNAELFVRDLRRVLASIQDSERFKKEYESLEELIRVPRNLLDRLDSVWECLETALQAMRAPTISIEKMRDVQRFLWLKSGEGGIKFVIVDGAEHMTEEAANSFLKISEDTPADSMITLTAVKQDLLKETIRSRCRAYRFVALSPDARREALKEKHGEKALELESEKRFDVKAMEDYAGRLKAAGLKAAVDVIEDVVDGGHAAQFFDFAIERLKKTIEETQDPGARRTVQQIYQVESALKLASSSKWAILYGNANPELVISDFILNNWASIGF